MLSELPHVCCSLQIGQCIQVAERPSLSLPPLAVSMPLCLSGLWSWTPALVLWFTEHWWQLDLLFKPSFKSKGLRARTPYLFSLISIVARGREGRMDQGCSELSVGESRRPRAPSVSIWTRLGAHQSLSRTVPVVWDFWSVKLSRLGERRQMLLNYF